MIGLLDLIGFAVRFYARARQMEQTVFHRFVLADVSVLRHHLFGFGLLVRSLYGASGKDRLFHGRLVSGDAGIYADALHPALQRRKNKKQPVVLARDVDPRRVFRRPYRHSVYGRFLLRNARQSIYPRSAVGFLGIPVCRMYGS